MMRGVPCTDGQQVKGQEMADPKVLHIGHSDPWVKDAAELVSGLRSGIRLSVGGFHFTRAPVAALLALMETGIKDLRYVAWGGGLPLEILLASGAVSEIEFCFSSLDIFGSAPRFRAAAESGQVSLFETTALSLMSGLRAEAENLDWEVMQKPAGSSLSESLVDVPTRPGRAPMVRVDPISVDVMLLHAQRADDDGNVELAGARGTDLSTIFAAKRVLVTVEERVARDSLGSPKSFILPRSHVSAVALIPNGAYPTSCLPYYGTDFRAVHSFMASDMPGKIDPVHMSPSAERPVTPTKEMITSGRLALALRQRKVTRHPNDWSIPELLTTLIARTVDDSSICSFGSAAPLPAVAYLLAKDTHAPNALLMSFNGGYVDIESRPMSLSLAEQMDFESAACHTGGDETYRWFYQAGRVTHEVVGAAQVDAHGATNNLWITREDGSRIRLPGQGGMADVANLHRDFVIYLPRQDRRNTVKTLETVSARRAWKTPEERESYGLRPGRTVVITNLCVFEVDPDTDELLLLQLHPGIEPDQVQQATGFDIKLSKNLTRTPSPSDPEITALRERVDPLGICGLDFVPARDRLQLINQILDAEDAAISDVWRESMVRDRNGA